MKKNTIARSVGMLAGLCAAAAANAAVLTDAGGLTPTNATQQTLIAGGIGHQLIVPYYNTQFGNATLFNIVNTDIFNGKAVKIRFRGASNSDDVFDFQLYMSPGDVWGATVTRGSDGRATLSTTDKSCTLPAGVGTGTGSSFVTARLPGSLTGDALAGQTREGYIEIFNMADIPANAVNPDGTAAAGPNDLFTAIKHVSGVAPCTAATLAKLATDPADIAAARALGFRSPSTGLFANYTIINVPKSGAATGEATAIAATTGAAPGGPNGRGNIVFFPQIGGAQATPDNFTADPALRTSTAGATGVQNGAGAPYAGGPVPIVAASPFDLPDLSTPYIGGLPAGAAAPIAQAEALTRALATTFTVNEFLTDSNIQAKTDWVFSLPTRRYSVALDYRPLTATPAGPAVRAFTKFAARDYFDATNTSVQNTQICVSTAGVVYYDREEATAVGNNFVISPNPPAPGFSLCGESSILTFNTVAGESVLGAEIARTDFKTGTTRDGWAYVSTPGLGTPAATSSPGGNGLPILGKAFVRASNPAVAAGISANFGGSWEHRYVRPQTP